MRPLVLLAGLMSLLCHGIVILNVRPFQAQEDISPGLSGLTVHLLQAGKIAATRAIDNETAPEQAPVVAPSRKALARPLLADSGYWPPSALQRQPVPVSAPDVAMLDGQELPSSTVRLRLFIDERGVVRSVTVKAPAATAWAPVTRMFEATRFLPGQRAGQNVASWVEIEVNVSDLVRVL